MHSVPPLPRKVEPQEGEPAYALLIRALEYHGARRIGAALDRITGAREQAVSQLAPAEVARICKADAASVEHATPLLRARITMIMGQALSTEQVGYRTRRWCPLCLAGQAYHRVWWDILPVTSCPMHGIGLATSCGCEGRRLRWRGDRLMSCRNGHLLESIRCDDAHADVRDMDGYVVGRLRGAVAERRPQLDDVPLGELLTLCERLGMASIDGGATSYEIRRNHDTGRVHAEGFRILGNIPANVSRLLENLRTCSGSRAGGEGLHKSYGGLYRFIRGLADHPIGEALKHTLYEHAGQHFPVKFGKQSDSRFRSDPGITLPAAADAVGMSPPRFRDLLDHLGIPYRARERGHGSSYRTEMTVAAFDALRPRLEGFETLSSVTGELGLPSVDVAELANAGLLDVVAPGQGVANWVFAAGSAGKLLASLREKAVKLGREDRGFVSLPRAAGACGVSITEILSFVLDGLIPVRTARARRVRMKHHGILLLRIDTNALADQLAFAGVADPSVASAAQRLGLTQATLDAVLAEGLLTTSRVRGLVRVSTAEIDRFRTNWVTISELKSEMGAAALLPVVTAMADAGIAPAARGARPLDSVYPRNAAMSVCAEAAARYASPPERGETRGGVAKALRVSPMMLRQLIETGRIAMQPGCRFGSISATEVARFRATYVTTPELKETFGIRWSTTVVSLLVNAGVRPVCGPPTLHYQLYDRRDAEEAFRVREETKSVSIPDRGYDGPMVGIADVCVRLGTNPAMALQLVRSGMLAADGIAKRGRRLSVPVSSVERFIQTYVFANELGRLAGRSHKSGTGKTISRVLIGKGLRPVCSTPEFPGYVFDRVEAVALMHRLGWVQADITA